MRMAGGVPTICRHGKGVVKMKQWLVRVLWSFLDLCASLGDPRWSPRWLVVVVDEIWWGVWAVAYRLETGRAPSRRGL